jgi:hypothetical protein
LICLAALALSNTPASASDGLEGQSVFVTWDNDGIRDSDRHYTQGARVGYSSADNAAPAWLRSFSEAIPTWGFKSEALKWGIAIGQEIYTPEDLDATTLLANDRPYAGWLYASVSMVRRGRGPAEIPVMETLRADLGIIGPEALGEQTQGFWHGSDPRGWDHQLDTEFGCALRYERRYLFSVPLDRQHWRTDLIPDANGSVGTVDVHLGFGSTIRFGYNIPNEFEVPVEARTPKRFGAYAFAGAEGRWVIHDVFLDGNTFQDSHSVDKEPLVGSFRFGLTMVLKSVEITGSYIFLSDEFEKQRTDDAYGSATLTFRF